MAAWPYERAVHPDPAMPEVPNLKFEREGNYLVIRSAGDGVSLDEPSIHAISTMMGRLADDIRANHIRSIPRSQPLSRSRWDGRVQSLASVGCRGLSR